MRALSSLTTHHTKPIITATGVTDTGELCGLLKTLHLNNSKLQHNWFCVWNAHSN